MNKSQKKYILWSIFAFVSVGCSTESPLVSEKPTASSDSENPATGDPPIVPQQSPKKPVDLIPLSEIWAQDMPGTKRVRMLEPVLPLGLSQKERLRRSSVLRIQRLLMSSQSTEKREQAGPAFVVVGTGKEALSEAAKVFAKMEKSQPERFFPTGQQLSLVFYSYAFGSYVRIEKVAKNDKMVTVSYRLVSHMSMEVTTHFALIPLGTLPEGVVHVDMVQLPSLKLNGDPGGLYHYADRLVSNSFSFRIQP